MSIEIAKKRLAEKGYADRVIEFEESTATVRLAAEARRSWKMPPEPGAGWTSVRRSNKRTIHHL